MKLSIATKLILLTTVLVAMTALTVTTYLYQSSANLLVDRALNDLTDDVQREGNKIHARMATLLKDVRFLAASPPMQGLLNARSNETTHWNNRLSDIFRTIAQSSEDIYQVRLIDASGNELIKIERNNHNRITLVPRNKLQNKLRRQYVRNSLKLKPGQINLSRINLNREFGKVTLPHTLVLRAATPVYKGNKLYGLVIMNIDFGEQIKRIEKVYRDNNKTLYVTSDDGTFFSHIDSNKLYGSDLGHRYRIQEEYPHLATLFAPGNNDSNRTYVPDKPAGNVKVFVKVLLRPNYPDRFITVGLTQEYENIVADATSTLKRSLWIVLLLVLTGVLLAIGFAGLLTTPLRQIVHGMDHLMGEREYQLPVSGNDEIGRLASTLNTMARNVRNSRHELQGLNLHLEDEVEKRTRELHYNLQLVNTINYAQTEFINQRDQGSSFKIILSGLLDVTESGFGLIGEIVIDENGTSHLQSLVTSGNTPDAQNDDNESVQDMVFTDERSLLGEVMLTGKTVISNDPDNDLRAVITPPGFPRLNSFLGIPIYSSNQLVGIVAIANRAEGYDDAASGSLHPFLITCANMINSIHARREARQKNLELQQARDDLDRAIESSKVVFYTCRATGDFGATFISDNVRSQMGYEPEKFLNDAGFWADHIHPDDKQQVFDELGAVFEHGEHSHIYRFLDGYGNYVWMQDDLKLHCDAEGNPHELAGFWTDVTERVKAEQQLRESEARFRRMADGAPALIWQADENNLGTWFNKRWLDYTGRTLEQEYSTGWTDSIHPEDIDSAVTYCNVAFEKRLPFEMEFRLRRADGSYGWIVDTGIPLLTEAGEFEGYIGYCWDISDRKLAEQALRESEDKFRSIITSSPMGVFIYELDREEQLRLSDFNPAASKILGVDCQPFVGLPIEEAFPELAETDIPKHYLNAARDGIPWNTEDFIYDDNHNIAGAYDVHAFQTSPNKMAVMFLDVTERLQARDELMHFKTTLDLTSDSVFMFYPESLRLYYVNQGAIFLSGRPHDELINCRIIELLADISEEELRGEIAPLEKQDKGSLILETRLEDKLGNTTDVEMHLQYIHPSGEAARFVAIMRDITERKKVERLKNEFVSTVSHELRTPLTSIRGALGLIKGGTTGKLTAKTGKMIDIANNNAERLLLLINDILDIQRIESDVMAFHFEALPVMPLLEKAMQDYASYAAQFKVKFELHGDLGKVHVFADEDRLMQVLGNLMSNAVKFSNPGDTVDLTVARHREGVRISVSDYGPGIPESFHDKLFERFTQSDSSDSRQKGGTGLGLSIARGIMEKHGGRINFVSHVDFGTTMYVEIPVTTASSDMQDDSPTYLSEHVPCLMLIENDPAIAAQLQRLLTVSGYNCDIATSMTDAEYLLTQHRSHYQALLVRVNQDGADSGEILAHLRKPGIDCMLPVLMLALTTDKQHRHLEGGTIAIQDWLTGPLDQQRLQKAMSLATHNKSAPRVLLIDNKPDLIEQLPALLPDKAVITHTKNVKDAIKALKPDGMDLVLLQTELANDSGLNLLPQLESLNPTPALIILSGQSANQIDVKAISDLNHGTMGTDEQLLNSLANIMRDHNC